MNPKQQASRKRSSRGPLCAAACAEQARILENACNLEEAALNYTHALEILKKRGSPAGLKRGLRAKVHYRRFVVRMKMGDHIRGVRDLNCAHFMNHHYTWEGYKNCRDGVPLWSLDHAISRFPHYAWFYAWRGFARMTARRDGEAAEDFTMACKLGVGSPRLRSWCEKKMRGQPEGKKLAKIATSGISQLEQLGAIFQNAGSGRISHLDWNLNLSDPGIREAIDHLRSMVMLQDFLAVFYELRPAAFYYDLPQRTIDTLRKLCALTGISVGTYRDPATQDHRCVWSRDPSLLAEYINDGNRGGHRLAPDTGYPSCCVKRDSEITKIYPNLLERPPYPILTLRGTRYQENYSYVMNFLYHLESRDWGKRGLKGKRSDYSQFHLLPWTPCSFVCADSLRYGAIMEKILRLNFPAFAKNIADLLKRPVLLFSDFELASLNGTRFGQTVQYHGWLDPSGLMPIKIKKILDAGDRITKMRNSLNIYKGSSQIAKIKRECELFSFS